MSDRLLDQADALMRRHSFVVGAKSGPDAPIEPAPSAADTAGEDVPILTDVVNLTDSLPRSGDTPTAKDAAAWRIEEAVRDRLDQLLLERSAELAQEIETWLDEQMPQLVIRAMDGITDHLVALLANRARDELLPRLEATLRKPDEEASDRNE